MIENKKKIVIKRMRTKFDKKKKLIKSNNQERNQK